MIQPAEDALAREARLITRYLVDRDCPPGLVERYVAAHRHHDLAGSGRAAAVAQFAFRHPWSLPHLDAAGALSADGVALRGKVLVMSAILETSPELTAAFLPRSANRGAVIASLALHGVVALATALVGLPLLLVARNRA